MIKRFKQLFFIFTGCFLAVNLYSAPVQAFLPQIRTLMHKAALWRDAQRKPLCTTLSLPQLEKSFDTILVTAVLTSLENGWKSVSDVKDFLLKKYSSDKQKIDSVKQVFDNHKDLEVLTPSQKKDLAQEIEATLKSDLD